MDTLHKYKDKPLYEVPEHFFEQFQHEVMQRVTRKKIQKQWFSTISVAASIALIFALSYFIFLNKNTNEHFYVHEDMPLPEDSIISFNTNHLAEVTEPIITPHEETPTNPEPLSTKAPLVAETIVYRAVDFYVDDFETDIFFDLIYELECYYDY